MHFLAQCLVQGLAPLQHPLLQDTKATPLRCRGATGVRVTLESMNERNITEKHENIVDGTNLEEILQDAKMLPQNRYAQFRYCGCLFPDNPVGSIVHIVQFGTPGGSRATIGLTAEVQCRLPPKAKLGRRD